MFSLFMNNANNDKMFSFVSHKQPVKSGEKIPYSQYCYHDVDRQENARIVQRLNVKFLLEKLYVQNECIQEMTIKCHVLV